MQQLIVDVECYPNYFLVLFRRPDGKCRAFEKYDGHPLDRVGLSNVMMAEGVELVSFNGNGYDMLMCRLAMAGAPCDELKDASDDIIVNGLRSWQFYRKYELKEIPFNHVDLIEVAPGQVGLKIYGGRLHCQKLRDLPYPPDMVLTRDQMIEVREYCKNDLGVTEELRKFLSEQVELRRRMSEQYGVDLRSKSDAQIAEAVLKAEYEFRKGSQPPKAQIMYDEFQYEAPDYIKFLTPVLRDALATICSSLMVIQKTGHVKMPSAIEKLVIEIGGGRYKIGIGGLHSQESCVAHIADDEFVLIDRDVRSYYPMLMLNLGMSPPSFGDSFTPVYRDILERRFAAKDKGDTITADSLKITLNGTFGKTSNKYSLLYSPKMMIRTTLTGQLSLLMLIEMLEMCQIPVVSANTDGVVIKCPRDKQELLNTVIKKWEKRTNLETEEARYKALYSRDVNNYIAIKEDGKVKAKGMYVENVHGRPGISKNPQNEICSYAVIEYLRSKKSIKETLLECRDIRRFLTLRTVNGGAVKPGHSLGKVVRWYYKKGEEGTINYRTNGNKVPRSRGAAPLMDLPDEFPNDVDYKWYAKECVNILMDIGAIPRPEVAKIPRKNSKAWNELVVTGKIEEDDEGKWVWV
jgi:hypothetical protein